MKASLFLFALVGLASLAIVPPANAAGLPDFLISKGGVIYPHTGDSTQVIFHTPPNVKEFLSPGMLLGVLPTDCTPASHGTIGDYYICHYELALKPEEHDGKMVYRVLDFR